MYQMCSLSLSSCNGIIIVSITACLLTIELILEGGWMNTAYYDMLMALQQQTHALIRRNAKIIVPDKDYSAAMKITKIDKINVEIDTYN